jgi:hypothetical protein
MLDDDEGHGKVGGDVGEKDLQRLEPAGRGADPDDGEISGLRRFLRCLLFLSGLLLFIDCHAAPFPEESSG